jgi:hypothetical protein
MRAIIAGSRHITNYNHVKNLINNTVNLLWTNRKIGITEIVSGGAKGVDKLGERWAEENGLPVKRFPARWDDLSVPNVFVKINSYGKKYNARAGLDRNESMAQYADILIAIWDGKSKGTKDMIDRAKKHGLVEITYRLERRIV